MSTMMTKKKMMTKKMLYKTLKNLKYVTCHPFWLIGELNFWVQRSFLKHLASS